MKTKKTIQFNGKDVTLEDVEVKIKDIWRQDGNLQKDIKSMELYIKPEENMCYYVINDTVKGRVAM